MHGAASRRYIPVMLSPMFEARLQDLLAAWRHHNRLRAGGARIPELARARYALDQTRHEVYRVRRALNPEPAEAAEAVATAYCETLDETVFLFASDAWATETAFACLCGGSIAAEVHHS